MKFTKEEKDIIHRVHLLSGRSYEEVNEIFESLCLCATLAFLEKEPIDIPLFGRMEVFYKGDKLTERGREAQLDIKVEPSPALKRIIGQIEDETESDIEKSLQSKIKNILRSFL